MRLYSSDREYKLYQGSMLDMLEVIEPNSIDSIVTDPPYELGFMNKGWDNSGVAFQVDTWKKCYTVLKSGGYLLAFGGTRTYHRIACAIEDAGFEIRDTIMWLYGSGFPKSMNIGLAIDRKNGVDSKVVGVSGTMPDFQDAGRKNSVNKVGVNDGDVAERKEYFTYKAQNDWDGWGTCLKPAYEPIIVARKPCDGSTINNVLKYGVGGINIDECRIPTTDYLYNHGNSNGTVDSFSVGNFAKAEKGENRSTELGRFPSNVILTYDETDEQEVCGGFPITVSSGGSGIASKQNTFANTYNGGWGKDKDCSHLGGLGDDGSASRYFYCAKASKKDRDEGLVEFETVQTGELQGGSC